MSCAPSDLRDYIFGELAEAEARAVASHVRSCAVCGEELERLRTTQATLLTLREEEIPQRIAFVSDRVWEPSGLRRWWLALWNSGPKLVFASAAMLSIAIVFSEARTSRAVAQVEARVAEQRLADMEKVAAAFDLLQKQFKTMYRANYYSPGGSQ